MRCTRVTGNVIYDRDFFLVVEMPKAYKRCDFSRTEGTSYLDSMKPVSKSKMIKKLGPPTCSGADKADDPKTDQEWHVPMGEGSVLTVYDYKGDKWMIGGFRKDRKKAEKLKKYLES